MIVTSKLLIALTMAAVAAFVTGPASAQRPAPNSKIPKVPAEQPTQIMPAGIYPLSPEREQKLKPKDSFRECDGCPEMVVMPKGSFTMGTPMTEVDRY